jgi:hypothetical protein
MSPGVAYRLFLTAALVVPPDAFDYVAVTHIRRRLDAYMRGVTRYANKNAPTP